MANETIVSQISQFVDNVHEGALYVAQQRFVMNRLVKQARGKGMAARDVTQYVEGTVDTDLGELEDLTPSLFERRLLAQIRPKEIGKQYLVTDRRVDTDTEDVMADAALELGYEIGKQVEVDLLAQFSKFTGGSVGAAGSALTWTNIYEARTRLAAASVPPPYNVVLHEWQWFDLAIVTNVAAGTVAHSMNIRNDIQSNYYLGSQGDLNFYVSALPAVDGNDDTIGGVFNPDAIIFDLRRPFRIEPQRDASLRAWELNATMIYGAGIWRSNYGVKVVSDVTPAGNAVTQNTGFSIYGSIDDATLSVGQDGTLTFTIVNNGTVIGTGITATLTAPAAADTFVSASPSQGSYNPTTLVWDIGSLAVGASAVLSVVYKGDSAASGNFVLALTTATPTASGSPSSGNIAVTVS